MKHVKTFTSTWVDDVSMDLFDIVCSTGTVYGQTYYTAKPVGWYGRGFDWFNMMDWCRATFGPHPDAGVWEPDQVWYANDAQFWFRSEADRTLFLLKWR